MASESLPSAEVAWNGLAGDRRWAFVREGHVRSSFPWLTIREQPDMWHYQPRFEEPDRPELSATIVRTPRGDEFDVADPALAIELGHGSYVIKQGRGVFDTMPLSLITTQTVSTLGSMVETKIDAARFRPNLVIDAIGDADFPEDEWVGRVLRIGGIAMRVDKRDQRCVIVNVDPVTTARDPAVLRTIAQERQSCLGVYGSTVKPGRVSVGEPVSMES